MLLTIKCHKITFKNQHIILGQRKKSKVISLIHSLLMVSHIAQYFERTHNT